MVNEFSKGRYHCASHDRGGPMVDVERFKRLDRLATDEADRVIGKRATAEPWGLAVMSGLAIYLVITVFRLIAGVVDDRSFWVQNILVAITGAAVYFYYRTHDNRWFKYRYEAHKRLEAAEADRERDQEEGFQRVKRIVESERRQREGL
jgi:hypothetical protein